MDLVLDSNEYIYAFGIERKPECEALILHVAQKAGKIDLRVPRMVADEAGRNINPLMLKELHRFWQLMGCVIDDDNLVPTGLFTAYRNRDLKPADALIGAYAEWVNAKVLVSENRDFLALTKPLPFRVMKASAFLKFFAKR